MPFFTSFLTKYHHEYVYCDVYVNKNDSIRKYPKK